MNESPFSNSSANSPLRRNRPSDTVLPPLVAAFRRAMAPSRVALAPAADCTSDGLMMSGSVTDSASDGDRQPASGRTAAAPASSASEAARRQVGRPRPAVARMRFGREIIRSRG